ncbi:hypothetical protein A3768_3283 [Ralstonia solanacearum]|nr:hypothetical protein A3768_3283 [Ralstonia solanacearum]
MGVVQFLGLEPVLKFPHGLQYRRAPGAVLLELSAQCVVHRSIVWMRAPITRVRHL